MAGLPARQPWLSAQLIMHMHACFDPTAGKKDTDRILDSIQKLTDDVQEFGNSVNPEGPDDGPEGLGDGPAGREDGPAGHEAADGQHAAQLNGALLACPGHSRRHQAEVPAQPASPPYPATVTDLQKPVHAEIDALAEFYSKDFGPSVSDTSVQKRLLKLAHFLGVPRLVLLQVLVLFTTAWRNITLCCNEGNRGAKYNPSEQAACDAHLPWQVLVPPLCGAF